MLWIRNFTYPPEYHYEATSSTSSPSTNSLPYPLKVGRLVKFKKNDLEAWLKKRTQEEKKDYLK